METSILAENAAANLVEELIVPVVTLSGRKHMLQLG